MKRYKILFILVLLCISIIVSISNLISSLFPVLQAVVFIFAVSATILIMGTDGGYYGLDLAIICIFSMFTKTYILLYPPSATRVDPMKSPEIIAFLSQGGFVMNIDSTFYDFASLYFLYPATFLNVSDISAQESMVIYPIIFGLLLPIFVYILLNSVGISKDVALTGSIFGVFGVYATLFGYGPIPQSLGVIYFYIFVLLYKFRILYPAKEFDAAIIILLVSGTLSHKLTLIFFAVVILSSIFYHILSTYNRDYDSVLTLVNKFDLILLSIISVLFMIQNIIMTHYIQGLVWRITSSILSLERIKMLFMGTTSNGPSYENAIHISNVEPLVLSCGICYTMSLVILSVFASLYLIIRHQGKSSLLLFYSVMNLILSSFFMFSVIIPQTGNVIRYVFFAEALFFSTIILGILSYSGTNVRFRLNYFRVISSHSKQLAVLFIIIVIAGSAIMNPAFVSDHPNNQREYLTQSEYDAKYIIDKFTQNVVYMDHVYYTSYDGWEFRNGDNHARLSSEMILERGGLKLSESECIAVRESIDFYQTPDGLWKLEWEPNEKFSKSNSLIYSNGEVKLICS